MTKEDYNVRGVILHRNVAPTATSNITTKTEFEELQLRAASSGTKHDGPCSALTTRCAITCVRDARTCARESTR